MLEHLEVLKYHNNRPLTTQVQIHLLCSINHRIHLLKFLRHNLHLNLLIHSLTSTIHHHRYHLSLNRYKLLLLRYLNSSRPLDSLNLSNKHLPNNRCRQMMTHLLKQWLSNSRWILNNKRSSRLRTMEELHFKIELKLKCRYSRWWPLWLRIVLRSCRHQMVNNRWLWWCRRSSSWWLSWIQTIQELPSSSLLLKKNQRKKFN